MDGAVSSVDERGALVDAAGPLSGTPGRVGVVDPVGARAASAPKFEAVSVARPAVRVAGRPPEAACFRSGLPRGGCAAGSDGPPGAAAGGPTCDRCSAADSVRFSSVHVRRAEHASANGVSHARYTNSLASGTRGGLGEEEDAEEDTEEDAEEDVDAEDVAGSEDEAARTAPSVSWDTAEVGSVVEAAGDRADRRTGELRGSGVAAVRTRLLDAGEAGTAGVGFEEPIAASELVPGFIRRGAEVEATEVSAPANVDLERDKSDDGLTCAEERTAPADAGLVGSVDSRSRPEVPNGYEGSARARSMAARCSGVVHSPQASAGSTRGLLRGPRLAPGPHHIVQCASASAPTNPAA